MNADTSQRKPSGQASRDQRSAAALRENLRRRKSQARARAAESTEAADAPPAAEAPKRESEP